jgi:hypothetical protein
LRCCRRGVAKFVDKANGAPVASPPMPGVPASTRTCLHCVVDRVVRRFLRRQGDVTVTCDFTARPQRVAMRGPALYRLVAKTLGEVVRTAGAPARVRVRLIDDAHPHTTCAVTAHGARGVARRMVSVPRYASERLFGGFFEG